MKFARVVPFVLCFALGACDSIPPAGPSMTVVAGPKVTEQKFAGDVVACRERAQAAAGTAANAAGQLDRQSRYDAVYSDCMLERAYTISQPVAR
ncbi:hypothetical protein [Rhodoblastus sp.]|jgi:hypothetical protein|uniref:hypothetical protein n=1 Tax=Rhodoblastus sp. TaxID=1962975 RepID=UPI0025EF03A8|nr:hypothetical protein [Rhodoblastus sp.]